jgi:hypothetical protein
MSNYPDGFNGDVGGGDYYCLGCGASISDDNPVGREGANGEPLECKKCRDGCRCISCDTEILNWKEVTRETKRGGVAACINCPPNEDTDYDLEEL